MRYALIHANVWIGYDTDEILENQTVLINNEVIEKIVPDGASIPSDFQVVDLKGQYLLLFSNEWGVRWANDKNPDLQLAEFSNN